MMLMLLMCVIMKIAEELTVDRTSEPVPMRLIPCCDWARLRPRRGRRIGKRAYKISMMEDPQTPGSDCNSNPASDPQDLVGSEFIQDNMEYQWFIDYRDGGLHVHPSVLSSLSASYTKDDLGYYDDLARNLDANLAEVDMESFRTADIHTLLTALPVMCTDPVQHSEFNYQRERYASISGSVMEKLDISSSISPRASSQGEDSACSTADTISICKSSLLFSPVKEMPVLPSGGSYSVDSLDCEDMLITCQTNNKNNYTIAFEGSIAMYSDGSQDFDNQEKQKVYEVPGTYYEKTLNFKNMLNLSMACSDSKIYTTWSNLKHSSITKTITRHPSGNNNTTPNFLQTNPVTDDGGSQFLNSVKTRSQSLPDLSKAKEIERIEIPLNFSVDSGETSSRSGRLQSSGSLMSRSMNEESSDSVGNTLSSHKKLQNMSLVRLFMKQKSMSTEGMSLILDQTDSSTETAWPTSSNSETATNNTQIHRSQQPQQNLTVPDNDLAIKWVKTDNYSSDIPKKSSNYSTSMEDLLNTSRSVSSVAKDASFASSKQREQMSTKTTTGTQVMTEVEDNGVQTSLAYPSLNNSKESGNFPFHETIVDDKQVYVIYPNYTLPDLSFLNTSETRYDSIALKPQIFNKRIGKPGRPFSCNDVDALKQRGFSHVKDWESLTFLLPNQYRKILNDVPEASRHLQTLGEEARLPLFCLSPPMKYRKRTLSDIITNTILSSSCSTATQPSSGYRGSSTILTDSSSNQQNSGNAALGNNPLYLYRYDSVSSEASLLDQEKILTSRQSPSQNRTLAAPILPKRSISLPQDTELTSAPPRPPLPRSILRKNRSVAVAAATGKRCSMFEMGQLNEVDICGKQHAMAQESKRMSLQEPYYMNNDLHLLRHKDAVDSEKDIDEIEERQRFDRLRALENIDLESSGEEVRQLEEFLKRSGFSSHSSDGDTGSEYDSDMKLRSCVRKFLSLKMNQNTAKMIDIADSQKKTVSFAVNRKQRQSDDKTSLMDEKERLNVSESADTNIEGRLLDLEDKKQIIWSVDEAVEALLKFWHSEPICSRQGYNDNNECSQLCLGQLCPALYAVMSDGLKPELNSTFGPITNSVWQVVEASSQQGPLTKTLNDLVQKINGEDFITEGMLKFHAFVFGLLNLRALDAWFAYLYTRESILRKHYNNKSLFIGALGNPDSRVIVNTFLNILHPLSRCPFQLDLLYQYRQLHNSFGQGSILNLDTKKQTRTRPWSCVMYDMKQHENGEKRVEEETKKRWSHAPLSAKFHIFDKLEDSDDYTDSLEHSPLNRASPKRTVHAKQQSKLPEPRDSKLRRDVDCGFESAVICETKFRKLQEKWEHLGRDDTNSKEIEADQSAVGHPLSSPTRITPTSVGKSKIPRPLASPVKTPANLAPRPIKSPSGIPFLKKAVLGAVKGVQLPKKFVEPRSCKDSPRRTSRLDQDSAGMPRTHLARPSSLPYKMQGAGAKEKCTVSPHRRAASTSLPRPHSIAGPPKNLPAKQTPKIVHTLTSKPKSEDGHLSFSEGEKLKVILEVDSKWLLCARGERKGLVPRSCVRPVPT